MKGEIIPVAIVTGGRLPQVLRQVHQIRTSPDGDTTPIIIFVDGDSPEAAALANLLQVTVIHHFSLIPIGESTITIYTLIQGASSFNVSNAF